MTDYSPMQELHNDIREIRALLQTGQVDVSERLARLETALIPIPGEPSLLAQHGESLEKLSDRLSALESWKNKLIGAWTVLTTLFGWHVVRHGS